MKPKINEKITKNIIKKNTDLDKFLNKKPIKPLKIIKK
jgi:hypothetical protein